MATMKLVSKRDISYDALLKEVHQGRHEQLASCSSVKYGFAELYRIGKAEYLIVVARIASLLPDLWIGGKQATGTEWRKLCKTIAGGVP
jgi:hypothetical protein